MRKKVLVALLALVVVGVPASIAIAEKVTTHITAATNDDQDEIFGVVRAKSFACEKRREVRLYGPRFFVVGKRGQQFQRYFETKTNRFGEYRFDIDFGKGAPPGDYFVRALRKDFPNYVCRTADSPIVSIGVE